MLSLLWALVLSAPASAQQRTIQVKEAPPAVDTSKLQPGEWVFSLYPPNCPEIPVMTGWAQILNLYTGDCWQTLEGKVRTLHAHQAEMVDSRMLFRADDIIYNGDTEDLHAEGHVYFYDFAQNEKIWCDRLEYHTEKGHEAGKFYDVIGETQPRITSKPGYLTTSAPFHFEGEWAERDENHYVVYNGWITDCTMPKPWWRLRGPKFDIIPRDRAKAWDGTFLLDGVPVFYFPWFYHSMKREPRKSGFLIPSPGHNSLRGFYMGAGYFWAINRSYDLTYEAQIFDSGLVSNHAEIRGKPRAGTDFDLVLFGSATGQLPNSPSGLTAYGIGKSQLGNGWTAVGVLNYTTTLLFRQQWSQSYNETVGSEIASSGYVGKNWDTFAFNVEMSRSEVFTNVEQEIPNPVTGKVSLGPANAVTIRKLPEAVLDDRDHAIFNGFPLWYSFDASAGLLFRSLPYFDTNNQVTYKFQTNPLNNRVHLAPHLTSAFNLGPVHFVPSIGIDETHYSESQEPYIDNYHIAPEPPVDPRTFIYQAVDTGVWRNARDFTMDVILPSLERVYNRKTFLGEKFKHVIEPRAFYTYVTGVGPDFSRYIRYDGLDVLSNTNQLQLSLTNRILAKRNNTVLEVFSWELAQQRYFDPDFSGAVIQGQRNVLAETAELTGFAFLLGPRLASGRLENTHHPDRRTFRPVAGRLRSAPAQDRR